MPLLDLRLRRYRKPNLSESFQDITEVKFQVCKGNARRCYVLHDILAYTFHLGFEDQKSIVLSGLGIRREQCEQRYQLNKLVFVKFERDYALKLTVHT